MDKIGFVDKIVLSFFCAKSVYHDTVVEKYDVNIQTGGWLSKLLTSWKLSRLII